MKNDENFPGLLKFPLELCPLAESNHFFLMHSNYTKVHLGADNWPSLLCSHLPKELRQGETRIRALCNLTKPWICEITLRIHTKLQLGNHLRLHLISQVLQTSCQTYFSASNVNKAFQRDKLTSVQELGQAHHLTQIPERCLCVTKKHQRKFSINALLNK